MFSEGQPLPQCPHVDTNFLRTPQELSLIPGLDLANHVLGSKNTCSIGVATADGQVVEERRGRVDPRPVHRGGFVPQATDAKQLEENEPEAVLTETWRTAGGGPAPSDHSQH